MFAGYDVQRIAMLTMLHITICRDVVSVLWFVFSVAMLPNGKHDVERRVADATSIAVVAPLTILNKLPLVRNQAILWY
jgi:hypothetical protein